MKKASHKKPSVEFVRPSTEKELAPKPTYNVITMTLSGSSTEIPLRVIPQEGTLKDFFFVIQPEVIQFQNYVKGIQPLNDYLSPQMVTELSWKLWV